MKSLVERCLEALYKTKLAPEAAEFLKKFGMAELTRGQYKLIDGLVYRRILLKKSSESSLVEIWTTHERVGEYKITLTRKQGRVREQQFYRHVWPFRADGPATLIFHENGKLAAARWSNDDACAARIPWELAWDERGNKQHEAWRLDRNPSKNGHSRYVMHREGGPALTVWNLNGTLRRLEWWHKGLPRRNEIGFTVMMYHDDGTPNFCRDQNFGNGAYPMLRGVDPTEAYGLCSRW